jgi:hypothetical protein
LVSRLWGYKGNVFYEFTLLSLAKEPMLDLQGCPLERKYVQGVLPKPYLERKELLIHILVSKFCIVPTKYRLANLLFENLNLLLCLLQLSHRKALLA